jgi:hypothetical protein
MLIALLQLIWQGLTMSELVHLTGTWAMHCRHASTDNLFVASSMHSGNRPRDPAQTYRRVRSKTYVGDAVLAATCGARADLPTLRLALGTHECTNVYFGHIEYALTVAWIQHSCVETPLKDHVAVLHYACWNNRVLKHCE